MFHNTPFIPINQVHSYKVDGENVITTTGITVPLRGRDPIVAAIKYLEMVLEFSNEWVWVWTSQSKSELTLNGRNLGIFARWSRIYPERNQISYGPIQRGCKLVTPDSHDVTSSGTVRGLIQEEIKYLKSLLKGN